MRRVPPAVAVIAVALLGGCGGGAAGRRATTRVVDGRRVAGHDVGPSAYFHYIQAQRHAEARRHDAAARELRLAAAFDDDAYLRARLGEELLALGQLDEAQAALDDALGRDPACAPALLALGLLRARRGDPAGSAAALEAAVRADPSDPEAYLSLAATHRAAGRPAAAVAALRALVRAVPGSVRGRLELAAALTGSGDRAGAIAAYEAAEALDPDDLEARVRLGEALLRAGEERRAAAVLREAFERSGDDPEIGATLVEVYRDVGDAGGVEAVLDALDDPGAARPRQLEVAELLLSLRAAPRARLIAERLLAAAPDDGRARLLLGLALERAEPERALAELGRITTASEEYPSAQLAVARVERERSRFAEALEAVARARAAAPDEDEPWTALAAIHERRGDVAAARRALADALSARPASLRLRWALAALLERAGQWEGAIVEARRLLDADPRDARALNFIGYTLAEHGVRLDEAERLVRDALALEPGSGAITDSLGWVCFKQGRLEEAQRLLEEASRLAPGDPEILRHLGDLYVRRSERRRALDVYRRALSRDPDERLRRDLEQELQRLEADLARAR